MIGLIATRSVLSPGSGTYVVLHVFLPLLVIPGLLVWRSPHAGYISLWSLAGFFSTMVWSVGGTPYRFERMLVNWPYVMAPVATAIVLVVFGAPLVAVLASQRMAAPPERELLALRLRRIVLIVFVLATIVAATAFELFDAESAVILTVYTAALTLPGLAVQLYPRPVTAWLWTGLAGPLGLLGIWVWLTFRTPSHGAMHTLEAVLGTIYVLVLVAIPLICITTRQRVVTDNTARASYRRNRQTSLRTPHRAPGAARSH